MPKNILLKNLNCEKRNFKKLVHGKIWAAFVLLEGVLARFIWGAAQLLMSPLADAVPKSFLLGRTALMEESKAKKAPIYTVLLYIRPNCLTHHWTKVGHKLSLDKFDDHERTKIDYFLMGKCNEKIPEKYWPPLFNLISTNGSYLPHSRVGWIKPITEEHFHDFPKIHSGSFHETNLRDYVAQ